MKQASRPASTTVFAIELHTSQPERLVQFYQDVLGVTFVETTYPSRRFLTELGRIALVISETSTPDANTPSVGGRFTLSVLSQLNPVGDNHRYFLHPKRPLAGEFPERYASRLQDPDGNYIALAKTLETILGRVPPISSWRGLLDAAKELASTSLYRLQVQLRAVLAYLLDRVEYSLNRPTYVARDIGGYTHLVGSREGLFVVNESSHKRVLRGHFFGVSIKEGAAYCFQSCGWNYVGSRGRVIKLTMRDQRIESFEVVLKGLDDGCHQIDFIDGSLMIVDCYNGRLLQQVSGEAFCTEHYPLGRVSRDTAMNDYHINSISGRPDGTIWVLLHNSNRRPSEVLVLDQHFVAIRRFPVDAGSAHNIVFTNEASEYLIADSRGGRVITATGVVVDQALMMPRGISLDDTTCVIGDSFFATRPFRKYVPGRVHFFDRGSWSLKASISLPAAPTDIRKLDGVDYSLSQYTPASSEHVESY